MFPCLHVPSLPSGRMERLEFHPIHEFRVLLFYLSELFSDLVLPFVEARMDGTDEFV